MSRDEGKELLTVSRDERRELLTVSRDEGKELLTVSRDVFSLHEKGVPSPWHEHKMATY